MSASPVRATGIDTLPELLVHRILSLLSPTDLPSAFLLSKDWHKLGKRSNTSLIRSVVPCYSWEAALGKKVQLHSSREDLVVRSGSA